MEQELDKILEEYEEGNMNLITLKAKLLHLFSVVGRSEQLPCKHEHIESSDGCDECMDCGAKNY